MTANATVGLTQPPRAWPSRYEMIDGLRGLAALLVVMHHLGIVPFGHYAVMLFFVISGYCIAAAVTSALRSGASFGSFMWRRLRRIYPPYFFAIALFVLTRVAKIASGGYDDLARPWLDWVQNLTLTQWMSLPFHPVADAGQNPKLLVAAFWSLNYEEQFYLVMASVLLLSRARLPMPVTVGVLAAVGVAWNFAVPGGWITGFFLEYWVHFSLGALLFYVLCVYPGRVGRYLFLGAVLGLGAYSAARIIPWEPDTPLRLRVYTEFVVVCVFTLLLYIFRPVSAAVSRSWMWRPVAALGAISYSLYLIHQFNIRLVEESVSRLLPHAWEPVRVVLMLALEILFASIFWYFCERPFLNRAPRNNAAATVPSGLEIAG